MSKTNGQAGSVAERLRNSKFECDELLRKDGADAGREWAENDANADEIETLNRFGTDRPYRHICDIADSLGIDFEVLVGDELGAIQLMSPAFARGFVEAVCQVYREHEIVFASMNAT
jgi:hypothetical protein